MGRDHRGAAVDARPGLLFGVAARFTEDSFLMISAYIIRIKSTLLTAETALLPAVPCLPKQPGPAIPQSVIWPVVFGSDSGSPW
jgi:hypothetical protein